MKKIFTIILLFIILAFPNALFAQNSTVKTRVGNPVAGFPSGPPSGDTIKIATDIKNAFDACSGGDTHGTSASCLRDQLSGAGYGSSLLDAFETRRASGIADGCTQCVGYIGLILTLMSGSPETLQITAASDATGLSSITAGDITFQRLPDDADLQPGDIGAHGGGFGHILMVNVVEGNIKFTALESNGNFDCRITDSREINRDGYVFFRKQ